MTKNNIVIENAKSKNNLPVGIRQQANGIYSCRINIKEAEGRWKNIEMYGFETVKKAQTARALMQAELIKNPALLAGKGVLGVVDKGGLV